MPTYLPAGRIRRKMQMLYKVNELIIRPGIMTGKTSGQEKRTDREAAPKKTAENALDRKDYTGGKYTWKINMQISV